MAVAGVSMDVGSSASDSRHAVRISHSIEDYPPSRNLRIALGSRGLDKFVNDEYSKWILRPPAADLKLVLEALSPGLDGWPLQRLNVLAQELIACGNDEDPMVLVCQEMRGLLQNVFEALAHEFNVETLQDRARGNEEERPMMGPILQIRVLLEEVFRGLVIALIGGWEEGKKVTVSRVDVMGMRGHFRNAFEAVIDILMASGREEARSVVGVCLQMRGLSENLFWDLFLMFLPRENVKEAMVDMCCQMQRLEVVFKAIDVEGSVVYETTEGSVKRPVSSKLDAIFWGNVSFEVALAMRRSGTLENVVWAFTWVETLLLEHDMLGVRSSGVTVMMENIRDRWHKLHFCMPARLLGTKAALDFHRRSALLSCGKEREAVQDFEAPGLFKGFEAFHLCLQTCYMYYYRFRKPGKLSYGYSWSQLKDKHLWWVQRSATVGPQDHENWLLTRLYALLDYYDLVGRTDGDLAIDEVMGNVFGEVMGNGMAMLQQINFELRFDFPVPLPEVEVLKLRGLLFFWLHRSRSGTERGQPKELVPEIIGPEVLDRPEVQNYDQAKYAYGCVLLRGVQLIDHHGLLEEGLEVFHRCLAKSRSDSSAVFGGAKFFEDQIFRFCKQIPRHYDLNRANRVQAFLVAHGDSFSARRLAQLFMRNMEVFLANCSYTKAFTPFGQQGFQLDASSKAGMEPFWKSKYICAASSQSGAYSERRYKMRPMDTSWKMKAFAGSWIPFYMFHRSWIPSLTRFGELAFQLYARSKAAEEAFWKCYKDTCAALSQAGATKHRYEVTHMDKSSKLKAFSGSWIPSFYMFHVHVMAAIVCRILPCPEVVTRRELAREALLCVETARSYRHEGFGAHINWDRISRAHRACGPGAVFALFAGLEWGPPTGYGRKVDLWPDPSASSESRPCTIIVVQDEGVASFLQMGQIGPINVQELVREISSACLDRKLESDSCRNALETLYDLLIQPLLDKITRTGNKCYPRRKLISSAVGTCKDVPFSILRNKDSGSYLFEEVKLAFTPSFLVLDHCQSRYEILQERTLLAGAGAAVAVGDPHYLPFQHIPLPGSRKEVDAICQQFDFCHPQHEIVKLLGGDATVEKVLELVKKASTGLETAGGTGQCSQAFIHMAAHGSGGKGTNTGTLSLADTPQMGTRWWRRAAHVQGNVTVARDEVEQSSDEESDEEPHEFADSESSNAHAKLFGNQVLEAPDSELDTAAEGLDFLPQLVRSLRKSDAGTSLQCDDILVSGLEWSAYMVVLSACDTALGVALNGNVLDILSFSRAFMTAGVPCSILAQWAVDDSAAVHLMPLFYQALSQGADACSALQSAMIKMHHSGKYTLHQLAPFIVTGLPTVRLPPQMRRCTA